MKIRTACTRDCPDACGIIATVEDGTVVKLQGDPNHPITKGFLCHRTSRFLERQYSKERLTKPLLRKSKSGSFEPISWNQALDLTAEKLAHFQEQFGNQSIMQYRCGGSIGIMKQLGDYFFSRFGPVCTKDGDICSGAGEEAQLLDFGELDSNDLFDIHNSKTIFVWGKNVHVSNIHLLPELKTAKKNGAKIVSIDPVHNQTSKFADLFVQPAPGSDWAIILGMVRWLKENQKLDPEAASYCDNLPEFLELSTAKTLNQWAEIADISVATLIELAQAYSNGPSSILMGWGMQRRKFGGSTIRLLDALAAVSGNLGIEGGGASFYYARRSGFTFNFQVAEDQLPPPPRRLSEATLGKELLRNDRPPVKMMYIWAANPIAMLPESHLVKRAIESLEFTVVADPFLSDTAQSADLVLPTTTMLEEEELVGAYGHHYLANVRPVTSPPEGVLSDFQIFQQLAARLGMDPEFQESEKIWKRKLLKHVFDAGVDEEEFENQYARNPLAKKVMFTDRVFQTETGKVNLIDTLPDGIRNRHNSNRLKLTSLSTRNAQGSQWLDPNPEVPPSMTIHPEAAKDFKDEETILISTEEGQMPVKLKFDSNQRKDIALMEKGGWLSYNRCTNSLIKSECSDLGGCAVYYDTEIDLKPVE